MTTRIAVACLLLCSACSGTRAQEADAASHPIRWTPPALSTDQYESSPSLSPDGRELFFFRADRQFDNYRLLQSYCEGGRWTPPPARRSRRSSASG